MLKFCKRGLEILLVRGFAPYQCTIHNAQLSRDLNFVSKGFHPLGESDKETTFVVEPQLLSFLKKKVTKEFKSVAQTSSPACSWKIKARPSNNSHQTLLVEIATKPHEYLVPIVTSNTLMKPSPSHKAGSITSFHTCGYYLGWPVIRTTRVRIAGHPELFGYV